MPNNVQAAWDRAIEGIADRAWRHHLARLTDPRSSQPIEISCTSEAAEILNNYNKDLERQKIEGTELFGLGGWLEKHPTRIARVAALFALLEDPNTTSVEARHVQAAMSLAAPAVDHAIAAFRVLRNVRNGGPMKSVLRKLLGKQTVSTRLVHRAVQGQVWFKKVEDVRSVLDEASDLGYVRPNPAFSGATGGRKTEEWSVHPWLASAKTGGDIDEVLRRKGNG